jgi:hypothetical protein
MTWRGVVWLLGIGAVAHSDWSVDLDELRNRRVLWLFESIA